MKFLMFSLLITLSTANVEGGFSVLTLQLQNGFRHIHNPVKLLSWSVFRKHLTTEGSYNYFCIMPYLRYLPVF